MKLTQIRNRQPGQKTACVVRYGAWGDAVLITPVLRKLHEDGYHVTLNCTERSVDVLLVNPHIDAFLFQETNEISRTDLKEHWEKLSKHFDRFINLSGSIEGSLLKGPGSPEFRKSKEELHAECNFNYMDRTMEIAGYPEMKGCLPELHFRSNEERFAKKVRKKNKGFLVVVSMTGSSIHKIYPWMGDIVDTITRAIKDSHVCLVGEAGCRGIIDETPQIHDYCGQLDIRKTFCLLKYADLVVTTETAVANAASSFDTPKVVILSHSSEENLTKYWTNCYPVYQSVSCYPCHKMHFTRDTCKTDETINFPICASLLSPRKVMDAVDVVYRKYLEKKRGT